ncbi:MAG: hypothetical protein LAT67_12025 [Balneolales bacterium]|nr:hypothetical protein [Balneolales bacterium]
MIGDNFNSALLLALCRDSVGKAEGNGNCFKSLPLFAPNQNLANPKRGVLRALSMLKTRILILVLDPEGL